MSEKKTDAVAAKFAAMDKPELQHALVKSAKKLGEAKKQILQKDKLIADFTSQREKAKREASQLIAQAKEHAEEIEKKVAVKEAELEKKIEETDAEVARKLTNANAEADSIVESRLNEAKGEIEKLERRRDEAKRAAIALNKNIIERYDGLITEVEEQISRFKDMQESLAGFNVDIEAEDFKKFDMSDYVTSAPKEKKASVKTPAKAEAPAEPKSIEMHEKSILDVDNDDVSLDDDELEMLAYVFEGDYDDEDEEEEETPAELEDSELLSDEDLDFLNSDFDFDMDFGDGDDDEGSEDIEVEEEEDDVFSDGTMKSFTDSFMAVRATDDDDDDLDDIDIDSILDDDDEEETPAPKITVPARRHRRSGKNSPSRWIN